VHTPGAAHARVHCGVVPISGRLLVALLAGAGLAAAAAPARAAEPGRPDLVMVVLDTHAWAAVRGRWKLIDEDGYVELYDTRRDPGETRDLASERPDLVRKLEAEPDRFRAGAEVPRETVEAAMDPAMLEALRALGYVDGDGGEEGAR